MTEMRVVLHNETDEALTLVSSEMPNGEWAVPPPGRIEARSVAVFGSESSGLLAAARGTEGRATYQIGDAYSSTVYIHWDQPYIGSDSFHTNTDDGHYAFWSAAPQGSTVHFTLRPAGETITDFLPSRDGFTFNNSWDNAPYSLPPLRGSVLDLKFGNADNGLCGGMTYAALDYFLAGMEIPQDELAPPHEGVPLFDFLVDRLFDSFDLDTVTLILKLMNPAYPDSDENMLSSLGLANGRAAVMAHQEWPIIRGDIDSGKPSPMVIITVKSLNPGELGECHQILAYGYSVHGHHVTIRVYDPNSPLDDTISLSFNDGDVANRIMVAHNVDVDGKPIYCFARMNYSPAPPAVPTRQRFTGAEIENRGISFSVDSPVTLVSTEIESGRREFDVWPDCGKHEFDYHVYSELQETTARAFSHGYRDPRLVWTINQTTIEPGEFREVVLLAMPDEGWFPRSVTMDVRLIDNQLMVRNRPEDGNYFVTVRAASREGEDLSDKGEVRTGGISFVGRRTHFDGLAEAMGQCLMNYVNARRDGAPEVSAAAVLAAAQLHRPGDPLWDPDPQFAAMTQATLESDPERESVQVLLESVAAPETAPVDTSINEGIDTHAIIEGGIDLTTIGVDIHDITDISDIAFPDFQ